MRYGVQQYNVMQPNIVCVLHAFRYIIYLSILTFLAKFLLTDKASIMDENFNILGLPL